MQITAGSVLKKEKQQRKLIITMLPGSNQQTRSQICRVMFAEATRIKHKCNTPYLIQRRVSYSKIYDDSDA